MVSEVWVPEDILEALLESARRKYPLEVLLFLGGRVKGEVAFVEEILYVPWIEGYSHAMPFLDQLPPGEVIGSFHSHPGSPLPSPEDLAFFVEVGVVHLIAGYPFRRRDVVAYDREGKRIRLRVGQRASF
ncbi:MAG: metalloprotease [Candidatus Diapherotrites archaeon]|nr:metalloprotease [Candidatus Diapherotrites archaeon]